MQRLKNYRFQLPALGGIRRNAMGFPPVFHFCMATARRKNAAFWLSKLFTVETRPASLTLFYYLEAVGYKNRKAGSVNKISTRSSSQRHGIGIRRCFTWFDGANAPTCFFFVCLAHFVGLPTSDQIEIFKIVASRNWKQSISNQQQNGKFLNIINTPHQFNSNLLLPACFSPKFDY